MNGKNWNAYIERQKREYRVHPSPEFAAVMVVVIPCYNEPGLFTTLQVYWRRFTGSQIATGSCSIQVTFDRRRHHTEPYIIEQVREFAAINNSDQQQFLPLLFEGLPRKHAGVGWPENRMDLAVEHFFLHDKANGG